MQKIEMPPNKKGTPLSAVEKEERSWSSRAITGLAVSPQGLLYISMPKKVLTSSQFRSWSQISLTSSVLLICIHITS